MCAARSRPASAAFGTDHVDLYQLHNPRMDAVERDDTFAELERLREEGKLRHYGVALGPAIGWRDEGLVALDRPGVGSLQTVYNLLEQQPGDDFLARALETGAGIMARVPTSSGLLEGRYTEETTFEGNDHRRHRRREWLLEGLKKVEQLRFLAIEGERTMTQAALKWILHQPGIACVVPDRDDAWPSSRRWPAPRRRPTSRRRSSTAWRSSTRAASGSSRCGRSRPFEAGGRTRMDAP
ncbi:MAG: aldo/keto reductase [Thermoleophilaceae bacterium]